MLIYLTPGLSLGVERTISTDAHILSLVIQDAKCGSNGGLDTLGAVPLRESEVTSQLWSCHPY